MSSRLKRVKLKGNESFNFREGWLRKGMRCVHDCENLFSQPDVMELLGVGSKMVKSIRFWLQASELCEEKRTNAGRSRSQYLTEFGRIIFDNDPYFDDIFTLFLVHFHIVSNDTLCMIWNIFFNEYEGRDFTKEDMTTMCRALLDKKMEEGATYSISSLEDDCTSILKMYTSAEDGELPFQSRTKKNGKADVVLPEDSLECPLIELGLLEKSSQTKGGYIKTMPRREALDKLAVLYVIISNMDKTKMSVSIDDLLMAPNNIGKVYNLNRVTINEYLDQLRIAGYLTINRTAGLDMVYVKKEMTPEEIMVEYYNKAQVR